MVCAGIDCIYFPVLPFAWMVPGLRAITWWGMGNLVMEATPGHLNPFGKNSPVAMLSALNPFPLSLRKN